LNLTSLKPQKGDFFMSKYFIVVVMMCLLSLSYGGITNITKVDDISVSGEIEIMGCIFDDELTIYYTVLELSSPGEEIFYEAARTTTDDPFTNITSTPFTNIMSSSTESNPCATDNGLQFFFSSDRGGDHDIFKSTRLDTSSAFGTPSKEINLSQDGSNESGARLAADGLAIYFNSDRENPGSYLYRLYRSTRPDFSSAFGAPVLISEISDAFNFSDVSNDELTMFFYSVYNKYYYSQRASTSESFPEPEILEDFDGYVMFPIFLNDSQDKVYFSRASQSDITGTEIYQGDIIIGPPATPTPTPMPELPDPIPPVDITASRDQIAAFTGYLANPWCGVFDSQGRYIFFDWKTQIDIDTIAGTNQLIRANFSGAIPSFEVLATTAQLAAVDSRWGETTYIPEIHDIDILSDGSVVLLSSGLNPQKMLKITPGNPPQISVIAQFNLDSALYDPDSLQAITVDKTQSPNMIYVLSNFNVYSVSANQQNADLTMWLDISSYLDTQDIIVDNNGDILYCENSSGILKRIDKNTRTQSTISKFNFASTLGLQYNSLSLLTMNIDDNNNIYGIYSGQISWSSSRFNILKAIPDQSGLYTAANLIAEEQIINDPDVNPWVTENDNIIAPGHGMALHPGLNCFYLSSGTYSFSPAYFTPHSINCIISIGTESMLKAKPASWCHYE
jgi:WD40 repeat protein